MFGKELLWGEVFVGCIAPQTAACVQVTELGCCLGEPVGECLLQKSVDGEWYGAGVDAYGVWLSADGREEIGQAQEGWVLLP